MLHGLGVGVGAQEFPPRETCILKRPSNSLPRPRLPVPCAGVKDSQPSSGAQLREGLSMATNAAQAQASSASGQGRGSSAADDPPDPSAAWYMTKAQLEKTPARKALLQKFGQDAEKAKEKEAQYRRLTVGFLQEAGQKLRLCVPRPAAASAPLFLGAAMVGGGAEASLGVRALLSCLHTLPPEPRQRRSHP